MLVYFANGGTFVDDVFRFVYIEIRCFCNNTFLNVYLSSSATSTTFVDCKFINFSCTLYYLLYLLLKSRFLISTVEAFSHIQ